MADAGELAFDSILGLTRGSIKGHIARAALAGLSL